MKRFSLATTLFATALGSAVAHADVPVLHDWNSVLDRDAQDRVDLGDVISDVAFQGIDRITFLTYDTGRVDLDLAIERKVFENRGAAAGTWSVVDQLYVNAEIPIWGHGDRRWDGFGFHLGFETRLGFLNVRQVTPEEYATLPDARERLEEVRASDWYAALNPKKTEQRPEWIRVSGVDGASDFFCPFPPEDVENRAKFCNFFERFKFPFRMPLKADDVANLSDGEIISYLGTGAVEFGPSVGFQFNRGDFADIGGGARFTYFLIGSFQINVQKEPGNFVKLSAGRATGKGWSATIGARIEPEFLDGVLLIGKLTRHLKIVPFEFRTTHEQAQSFKVTYRYDLTNPHARQAYEEAVAGRLALSDLLTTNEQGETIDPAISGVAKIETRREDSDSEEGRRRTRLSFVFKKDLFRRIRDVEVILTTPEGTTRTFETMVTNSREARFMLSWYEKLKYFFTVSFNETLFERDPTNPSALRITVAAEVEDNETYRDEMLSYIHESEDTVARTSIYPRPPRREDLALYEGRDDVVLLPRGHFGETRFEYTFDLKQEDVRRILETARDEGQQWASLEQAFRVSPGSWSSGWKRFWYKVWNGPWTVLNIPLYLADVNFREGSMLYAAENIKDAWTKAAETNDPRTQTASLGRMFYNSYYSYELVRLLRDLLHDRDAHYKMSGYSLLFGQIRQEGTTKLSRENVSSGRTEVPDAEAIVRDLSLVKGQNGGYELRFDLAKQAEAVFIQFRKEVPRWWIFDRPQKAEVVVFNSMAQPLAEGGNAIALDPADKASPFYEISRHLEPGDRYKFQVSYTVDGMSWGEKHPLELKLRR